MPTWQLIQVKVQVNMVQQAPGLELGSKLCQAGRLQDSMDTEETRAGTGQRRGEGRHRSEKG